MVSPNVSACHLACCSEQACGGFTYTPYLDRAYTPSLDRASPACARGSSCCFLKTRGALKEQLQPRRAAHDERDTARPGARAAAGGSCQSPDDCFGGGDCASRRCACDATWTGPHCEQLHLLPIDAVHPGFPVDGPGPTRPSLPTNSTFPWGGAVAEDQGVFHLLFTEWLNHCPMTFKTFATSTHIAHATAPTAVGPWTRVGVAVPQAAGNPALSRAPDGTWLLYFTNYRWDSPVRNCTGPASATSWGPPAYQPTGRPYPGGKACGGPHGEAMGLSLAYSKNLSGPWTIKYDVISVPATNPGGPVFLGNGTLLLPFQTWLPTHECTKPTCITIVSAPSWDAFPYRTCPLGTPGLDRSTCIEQYDGPLSVEDPSNVWRDKRGNLHVLMHQAHTGGRAWIDDNGSTWHYNYNITSYSFAPALSDGTRIDCASTPGSSRGEPRVLLNPRTGLPTALSTVCFQNNGPALRAQGGEKQFWSRILLQRINADEGGE